MTRKIRLALAAGMAGALVLVASGCGANTRDLEGVPFKNPDKIEVYINIDDHPNVARLCIGGVAFFTTSRNYGDAIGRVPEWDAWCKS